MSVHYNGRSQSSDGESLPDDVFHDDGNVGVACSSQAPPTSSVPPPKPPRVGGSSGGIASFINKNGKKLRNADKRTSSESGMESEESSKPTADSKGGGGRRWSFKSGKSKRQQSVPVDMKLAQNKGQVATENGSVSSLTGNEIGLSSSTSVSPTPLQQGSDDVSTAEATLTASSIKPRPPASSSTHNSNLDLGTLHEGVESADSKPPAKPVRQVVSNRQISSGTRDESKPSPKPRQKQHPRAKLFSDSQVLNDNSKSSGRLALSKEEEEEDEGNSSGVGGASGSKGRGKDTLERDNMLLREQVKMLKGQNKKLKKENKQFRSKFQDGEEWDVQTSSSSHSESVSPFVTSPRESPPTSQGSSREPSRSPARDVVERTNLPQSDSTTADTSREVDEERRKGNEDYQPHSGDRAEMENSDELSDVPRSLPSSSDVKGRGVANVPKGGGFRASSVPSMLPSKQKPIPIPRSGTVSIGESSNVVKVGSDEKVTRGFILKKGKTVDVDDTVPTNTVGTVRLESVVAKLDNPVTKQDSPVPKPRVNTNLSEVYSTSDGDNRNGGKCEGNLQGNDDSNKEKEKEKLNARRTLESLLPHIQKQMSSSKPAPHPRSLSTQENETKKEPLTPRATSLSPMRKVGMMTLGSSVGGKTSVIPEGGDEAMDGERGMESESGRTSRDHEEGGIVGSEREEVEGRGERSTSDLSRSSDTRNEVGEDELTASMSSNKSFTSSISSVGKGSLSSITKPLPPTPPVTKASVSPSTKPLPLTPPTTTKQLLPTPPPSTSKPLPSTPPTSTTKPLPPTPTSSTTKSLSSSAVPAKPLPPTPTSSTTAPPKPLPPTPSSTTSKPPPPIKVGVSSTSSTTTSSPPSSATSTGAKDLTGSISPKTPTPRAVGTGYKKITIQSDTSWINRRKEAAAKESMDGAAEKRATPGPVNTGSQSSTSGITSPTGGLQPSRPHAPYRSHAILPTPSPTTAKSFITPGMSYSGPPSATESKPPGPTGKLPPPKLLVNSRTRTESVTSPEPSSKKGGAKGSDKESPLLRSTSEENFSAVANTKGKGQSKGGIFSRSGTKKEAGKKPSKAFLRGKDKGSSSAARPQSALIVNNGPSTDRGFTGSCTVSTMPRGPPPEDAKYSPKSSRRKKAASEQDLYNGSPGRKSRGFLGRFKHKPGHSGAPPLEEEPECDSGDSSSDDEKGGTIKFKPKLRHVTVKKPMSFDDDSEPEYHQLFEYVFVVGLKEKPGAGNKGKLTTELTYNFPPASDSAKKDVALQSIPQFCFPDVDQWKPVKDYKSETFSFVLTDMEGHRRYGYCRRLLPQGSGKRLPEVYCIVSPLGCFSLYEKILDNIEERRSVANAVSVFTFLKAIVANPFPRPGRSVEVPVISTRGTGMETVVFERPMDSRLEHVDFSLLFNTLSQRKVIQVFSSLLMERRVILCAQSLSLLSGCAHALLALLYPFEWQHVFIPVLPSSLIDFVCSPLPYIIGINPSCIKQIETMETMEEALIVDLDKKKFVRKIGDETSILPTKLFQFLETSLSSSVVMGEYSKKSSDGASRSRADEVVVNTFMTFFAYLYGDCKSYLTVANPATGEKEFQRNDFVKKFSSKSTKRFLEAFQMTQMFENFIEQRENPSKAAMVSESMFEKKFPELSRGCQEIEIFSSKSRFGRWKIKKGLASNS